MSQLSDYLQTGISSKLMRAVIEYSALYGAKSWRYLQRCWITACWRITTPEQFEEDWQQAGSRGFGDFAASAQRFSGGEGSWQRVESDFAVTRSTSVRGRGVM